MRQRLYVSTREGLFSFSPNATGYWTVERVSFLGQPVSLCFVDARDGSLYAALGLGRFGVKLWCSRDEATSWAEVGAPSFPTEPEGAEEALPDGKPWPRQVEQIWSLEAAAESDLLCGTVGGGLFRSSDRAGSWQLVESLWQHPLRKRWSAGGAAELPGIHSICVGADDPRQLIVGVSSGGVWRSSDDGASWELASEGMIAPFMPPGKERDSAIQDSRRVVQCRSAPRRLWAQHHNGVFRSDDRGRSWCEIDSVQSSAFGFALAVAPGDPDTAWSVPAVKDEACARADGRVVVARTRDAGKTWQVLREGLPQEPGDAVTFRHALAVDAEGRCLAVGSSTGSLWLSEDAGDRFRCLSAHLPPINATCFGSVEGY
jgi:photosystem II stability/assembly factor-like uncharacterized protein